MRQNSFLVDALARLALKWTTDRGDWRERPMGAAAGCERGGKKETIRATSSFDKWLGAGRGRQAQGSRSRS